MSVVTGLILVCSIMDGAEPSGDRDLPSENVKKLNAWLAARHFAPLKDVADEAGGSKHPQCRTFHCGYNAFLEEDEFAAEVLALKWAYPENVVLIMQPEEGPTRIFRPS